MNRCDTSCTVCSRLLPLLTADPLCPCGGVPAVPELGEYRTPGRGPGEPLTLWRWRFAYPLSPFAPEITLGEGLVPVQPLAAPGLPDGVFALRDDQQPTGSWKDRGAALLAAGFAHAGLTDLVEDSSGNAALALARYAAAARLTLTAYVPTSTAELKKALIREAGAEVVEVPGGREAAAAAARATIKSGKAYASHTAQPLHLVGAASAAFNIYEALGRMPGAVVLPLGQGGYLAGLAAGFGALTRAGRGAAPRLIGVQSDRCAPLARAFAAGAVAAEPWPDPQPGLAEGVLCPRPVRHREALAAVRATKGLIAAVDDLAVEHALRLLWRHDLRVEPAAALPLAFLRGGAGRRAIAGLADVVVALSGRGVREGRPLFAGLG